MIEILTRCAQVEDTIAEIYRRLAEGTEDNPELERMWAKLSLDEGNHGDTIRFALRMNPREHIDAMSINLREITALLEKAKEFLALVKEGSLSDEEALDMAVCLEDKFKVVHVQMAAEFAEGQMKNMFRNLGKGDQEHLAELQNYLGQKREGKEKLG